MKTYRDPVHRQRVLERERQLAKELFRTGDEAGQREAARFLKLEHHLPEPQTDWVGDRAA